ncbi:unnamed protein product [Echinostoma caproni]|uniref:FERM domain-containing protein n=1 Tax=Echinostoma caproni TaxID=27848 RepID=A0A183AM32_9TREM|nr:unnamed protein product [Echinostoma caproni]
MSSEEAKDEFIRVASQVETYGMEPFQVMDQLGSGLCIGFNYIGISAFKNGQRTNVFPCEAVQKMIYPDDEWDDRNEDYNQNRIPRSMQIQKIDAESQSNSSQSSNEEIKSGPSVKRPPIEITQAPHPHFLPVPRHSLAVPGRVPLLMSHNSLVVPRDSFGGSMDLRSKANDTEPQVLESLDNKAEPLYLITRSSINLIE